MSQESLTQQLAKANGDVTKLCEFFAARKDWDLAADAGQPAHGLLAAATKLDEHLNGLIRASGAEPADPLQPKTTSVDAGSHAGARLVRFAAFLQDLDTWLVAQPEPTNDPDEITALRDMEANLSTIITMVAALTTTPDQPSDEEFAAGDDGASQAAETDDMPGEAIAAKIEGLPKQLVLDDTEEKPMVHEFQERNELTTECKELVDGFLAAWSVDYSYYKHKKLLDRLLRWITTAPEGQVLVLKMTTAEKPYEPYPSYVSREVLAGDVSEEDPLS